jgi:cation transport regulator ChaC
VSRPLWIFGYGSLVWRPDIPHDERRPAWIRGFARRFWQGSTDHRGVPEAPGRVVTLVREEAVRCWGAAYRVAAGERDAVLARLDQREKGGYEQVEVSIHFGAGAPHADGLVYVATERNRNYLGPAPLDAIAHQVRGARGPSGANLEYVLRLADSLREMDARDPHVFALEALLRQEEIA